LESDLAAWRKTLGEFEALGALAPDPAATPGQGRGDESTTPRLADLERLHQEVHRDDPAPTTENEHQAATIFAVAKQVVVSLINDGVGLRTLELALLYHWLRLATLNRGYDDDRLELLTTDLDRVIRLLVTELKSVAGDLQDDGPSPTMVALGKTVEALRDAHPLNETPLPRDEIERQTDKAMRALFSFNADCLKKELHPGLLESAMLYYWLRSSTLAGGVQEDFFQKLERHWPVVVKRVGVMIERLLNTSP
jgi:hypothetical protein